MDFSELVGVLGVGYYKVDKWTCLTYLRHFLWLMQGSQIEGEQIHKLAHQL